MLSCKEVAERADAWLDGEIPPMQAMQIRLHLAMCKGCDRFMGQMRTTRVLVEKATDADNMLSKHDVDDARISAILSQLHDEDQSDG